MPAALDRHLSVRAKRPRFREAEAALRAIRRRRRSLRSEAFGIVYLGLLAVLLVGPGLTLGVVAWRSGLLQRLQSGAIFPPVLGAPANDVVPGTGVVVEVSEEQATVWLHRRLQPPAGISGLTVRFRPGLVLVEGASVTTPPQPFTLAFDLVAVQGRLRLRLLAMRLGATPSAAAPGVEPLVVTTLNPLLDDLQRTLAVSEVTVSSGTLRLRGQWR